MRKGLILPILAAALLAGACEEDDDLTGGNQARIRFFNAISGVTGNVGFTTGGTFVSGSSVAFATPSGTCASVASGSAVSVGFGASNTAGTALSGTALVTANQNLTAGGNFTVIAAGSATSPSLVFLNNSFSGTLGSNQAAVRFVNLVPTATTANLDVFAGSSTTATATDITFGNANTFGTMTSGANTFTIRNAAGTNVITNQSVTLNANTINTIAIVPTTGGGFNLVNITAC